MSIKKHSNAKSRLLKTTLLVILSSHTVRTLIHTMRRKYGMIAA